MCAVLCRELLDENNFRKMLVENSEKRENLVVVYNSTILMLPSIWTSKKKTILSCSPNVP